MENKIITPEQCRAARAFLNWSQDDLSSKSGVAKATIADFERGKRTPYGRTLRDLQKVFEEEGIEFQSDERGFGVKLLFQNT